MLETHSRLTLRFHLEKKTKSTGPKFLTSLKLMRRLHKKPSNLFKNWSRSSKATNKNQKIEKSSLGEVKGNLPSSHVCYGVIN